MTDQPSKESSGKATRPNQRCLSGSWEWAFIAYNLLVALAFTAGLIYMAGQKTAYIPHPESARAVEQVGRASQPDATVQEAPAGEAGPGATAQSTPSTSLAAVAAAASASNVASDARREPLDVLTPTMLTLIFAGGVGRMLCNLRGIFKHYHEERGFPTKDALPFLIGPGMGAMVGLVTFFVATLFNAALADASSLTWAYFPDRFAYIALATVAGFGSQEFLQRLKAVAQTTFSEGEEESREEPPPAETTVVGHWTEGQQRSDRPEPAGPGEVILVYGKTKQGDSDFRWFFQFGPGMQVRIPEGDATAIRISGGTDRERRAVMDTVGLMSAGNTAQRPAQ